MIHALRHKVFIAMFLAQGAALYAEDFKVSCPNPLPKIPTNLTRSDTYKNSPFKAGEVVNTPFHGWVCLQVMDL